MSTFIAIFIVFSIVMFSMAIGVIFGRKPITGSCGGLNTAGIERSCGCTDTCQSEIKK